MRLAVVLAVSSLACGRIGIEARTVDPVIDAADSSDAAVTIDDAAIDGPAGCPTGTTSIVQGATVCVEQVERGNETYSTAKSTCEALGRRLCTDAEWATGCDNAADLIDMADDGRGSAREWEWVADIVTPGEAAKRGFDACGATSSHEIFVDPYDYRCCVDI